MDEITLSGGDSYKPIKINLDDLNINHTFGGNYGSLIQLDINGSSLNVTMDIAKPKVEVLTELLGKLLQFRESDLAKLSLLDREQEITNLVDDIINKIRNELITY